MRSISWRNYHSTVIRFVLLISFAAIASDHCIAAAEKSGSAPPPVAREFRGVWVATVQNIDWPSKPGLPVDKQKRELIAILDKCVELNINAVIFQVRTQADALYASRIEPWSNFLTGKMGKAPEPFYDPLEFAVEEAHKRGLQLHAWFNPYRVRVPGAKGPAAENHASVALPNAVRKYGEYLWFDPGAHESEEQFIGVLKDVVSRYDVDGVHIDDYFYPYQVKDKEGKIVPFPDDETYKQAQSQGMKLERDDWRRRNVDHLIHRMYDEVKKIKPWVLVGISPFGIWRPQNPKGVEGLDQYSTLYADARKWDREGWIDYMTPQLYWKVESKGQPYAKLLGWWAEQNTQKRHLWPGNFTSKIGGRSRDAKKPEDAWTANDIIRQIEATRATPGATGNVHFSMKALMQNKDGISNKLKKGLYAEPALVPESPWLGRETPGKPQVTARKEKDGVAVEMKLANGKEPWQWVVRVQTAGGWKTSIVPGGRGEQLVELPDAADAKAVTVAAVSRLGREGKATRARIE
jgi:uncharacterized lipoprotein YddW (UPF0748 family)